MTDLSGEDVAKVLVVDDEEVIREILADFLTMEGFYVRTAEDGSDALVELSRDRFDLVLSDLKMPNMGGLELLGAIRKHTPHVVTIIMTGFGTVETAIEAMKQGAYDYVLKPFKVEEVVHTIRRGLEKQRLQAENFRLKEALSLYKVSEAIAASLSLEQVVHTLTRAAIDEVDSDVVTVILSDGSGSFYRRNTELNPNFRLRREPDALSIETLNEYFIHAPALLEHGERCLRFFETPGEEPSPHSLAVAQLTARGDTIGFLCALSYTKGKRFDEGQRKLLHATADRASAAIENARLYEDLQATFKQTIRGLASAIDKMDRYTAGHSARVAAYAQILAIKLGLSDADIEIVRQSALMHDIGKIGCVMNLNKPGRLSQQEYEIFKQHPDHGRDILQPIEFLHPLIPGVHLHHERWDGLGYPLGLRGTDVPLIARIIAVADTYDAMTSDRAYRKALHHDIAISEIHRCGGTQFDPELAHGFLQSLDDFRSEGRSLEEFPDVRETRSGLMAPRT
ncbi:MAG: HD domain-containing phosphohydrolase [Polyangiales bacterium]